MKKTTQRGDVPLGCIVGLIVMGVAALIALKVIPIMIHVGDLQNTVQALADRSGRIEYNDARIVHDILIAAQQADLPVTKKDIKIERNQAYTKIWVRFTMPIDFGVYTYIWNKEIYENRPRF